MVPPRNREIKFILLLVTVIGSSVCILYTASTLKQAKSEEETSETDDDIVVEVNNIQNFKNVAQPTRDASGSEKKDIGQMLDKNNFIVLSTRTPDLNKNIQYNTHNKTGGKDLSKIAYRNTNNQTKGVDLSKFTYNNTNNEIKTTSMFNLLRNRTYTKTVAIVTLLRDAERFLDIFAKHLINLRYPHNLLSVYFAESESKDNTFEKAVNITSDLRKHQFNESVVSHLNLTGGYFGDKFHRHKLDMQKYRRAFIAKARNQIVRQVLEKRHFDFIIMIDSDIVEFPADLVQEMLEAQSDIVATTCLERTDGKTKIYDWNSWRETVASLRYQANLPADALVMEGYGKSYRIFLPNITHEGPVVSLDGVGACALMINAVCFKHGLVFPEYVYKHHLETEGLAKMAKDMGFSVVGLPFVKVYHYGGV